MLDISKVFGSIEPENFYQNPETGANNIESARAAMSYLYMHADGDWEHELVDLIDDFNSQSEHVYFSSWTEDSVSPVLAEKKL